jgi:Cys-tRNA synthase (O-phospho-L-seryl-tRNA:Cys-tRNA synthase)
MKTLTNEQEIKGHIKNTLVCNEIYKTTYYWQSSNSPRERRLNERQFHNDHPDYTFKWNDYEFIIEHRYDESSKHCFYKLLIYKDDLKTNVMALRNIFIKLMQKDDKDYNYEKLKEHLNEPSKMILINNLNK